MLLNLGLYRTIHCDNSSPYPYPSYSALPSEKLLTVQSAKNAVPQQKPNGLFYNTRRFFHYIALVFRYTKLALWRAAGGAAATLRFVFPRLEAEEIRSRLKIFRPLARISEAYLRIPFTHFRIGLTTILGFIPFVSGAIALTMSAYPLILASQLEGLPNDVLARMVFNAAVGAGVGMVPFVGGLLVTVWRPTLRNLRMLDKWVRTLEKQREAARKAQLVR
ncbi:hypothetical protein HK097_003848 [Rhizophlyctis rosea]|uniref:Uncharacterized protein n=1 Tax=Rhizophlyctis rosea TaxID=64517 RepID=A0AAD5S4D5_9FUNG|nr:hypothetical protein HK097_003848 [Rhizophlyctis rosea]